ncbi:MAG: suppressor of fused domain protein [Pirellulales bacterium]|nr:suppressor of fused domain protein [Pirellulales bacterium]
MANEDREDWNELWDARLTALETVLGKSGDVVFHGVIPFFLGWDLGGTADIIPFYNHLDGVVYVTADLIGSKAQEPSFLGEYELMIVHRDELEWGRDLIGRLAHYTLDAELKAGDTMDLGPKTPEDSQIEALLFDDYASFEVMGNKAGLLLCMGITKDELNEARDEGSASLIQKLKAADVYPFTDLNRMSVI